MEFKVKVGDKVLRNSKEYLRETCHFQMNILRGSTCRVEKIIQHDEYIELTVVKSPVYRRGVTVVIPKEDVTDEYFEVVEC